jgi:hypothetical protein
LIPIEKLVIMSTVESFALKALIPFIPHIIVQKFNWFDERARVFSKNSQNIRKLEIQTVNDCNKSLSTYFNGSFPQLEFIHVPINTLQNDSMLMLIKALGESMPNLEFLDLSFMVER